MFDPYVQEFEHYYGHRINNRIDFGVTDGDHVAECYYLEANVVVRKEFWDQATDLTREQLMFHELGHCVLGRQHTTYGIMHTPLLKDEYYKANRDKLIEELFMGGVYENKN